MPNSMQTKQSTKGVPRVAKWIGFYVLVCIVASVIMRPSRTPDEIAKQKEYELQDRQIAKAIASCQTTWEKRFKTFMKDPSSLKWDIDQASVGQVAGKHSMKVATVPYRATNSYGGPTLEKAICEINAESYEAIRALE